MYQIDFTVMAASSSEASALTQAIPLDIQDEVSGFAARFNAVSSVNISESRIYGSVLCADSSGDNTSCATLTGSPTIAPAEFDAAAATVTAAVGAAVGVAVAGLTATFLVCN